MKEIEISGTPQLNAEVAPASPVASLGVALVSGWVLLVSVSQALAALPSILDQHGGMGGRPRVQDVCV